jgi:chaperonin GroEL (HSP60 family)
LSELFFFRAVAGKEQLIIAAMAKALEIIPRQLCDNAGFDATNILNKLRQKHAQVGLASYPTCYYSPAKSSSFICAYPELSI